MSKINDGPAFPSKVISGVEYVEGSGNKRVYDELPGMTLRDYFAAKALTGVLYMVAHGVHDPADSAKGYAVEAYKLADEMLQERAK